MNQRYTSLMVITVLMSVVLVGLSLAIAYARGAFDERVEMRFETDSGSGLFQGMKITYRGFDIGRLETLELLNTGVVVGEITVKQSEARFLRVGSYLKISKEKIVTSELVLQGVDYAKPTYAQDEKIALVRGDVTDDVTKRLDPILDRVTLLLEQIADPTNGLQATLKAASAAMVETGETLKVTRTLLADIGQATKSLPLAINDTRAIMQKLGPVTEQTGETLKALVGTINQTTTAMATTNRFIKNLDDPEKGIRATLKETSTTLQQTQSVLKGVDATVRDFREAPVIRWMMPKSPPQDSPR